jgi:hypothetical protein
MGIRTASPRVATPQVVGEAPNILRIASSWQGSAGVTLVLHKSGRVFVDGVDVGPAPLELLLAEGDHTVVVRDGMNEVVNDKLKLRPGDRWEK